MNFARARAVDLDALPVPTHRRSAFAPIDTDTLARTVARLETLLAAAPEEIASRAQVAAAEVWFTEVEVLLAQVQDADRARLLAVAAQVRARLMQARSVINGSPQREAGAHIDEVEAAQLYEALGHDARAAATYVTAAVSALRQDEVSTALELAVRGIVTFNATPISATGSATRSESDSGTGAAEATGSQESAHSGSAHSGSVHDAPLVGVDNMGEAPMALALSRLCWEFGDHERAMRFAEIAAGESLGNGDPRRWTTAATLFVEAALQRRHELGEDAPECVALLERAEVWSQQLCQGLGTTFAAEVTGPRLMAEVRCEQGDLDTAATLVGAALAGIRRRTHRDLHADLSAVRLTMAKCCHLRGEPEQALKHLDQISQEWQLTSPAQGVARLRLSQDIRESAGDLTGALRDARRLCELISDRHQRQISGFLDQVWGLAAHESRRRALEDRQRDLIRVAEQDELTRLANRRGVERFCSSLLPSELVCLIVVDVDHFKRVNDSYGHVVGDQVLQLLADTMYSCVRSVDLVGRWGGEEFVLVLPGITVDLGIEAAARIRARVGELDFEQLARGLSVTISAGVATGVARDLDGLLRDADRAMYRAKQLGRDRVAATRGGAQH